MEAAEHVLRSLQDTWNETITYTRRSRRINESWSWVDADWACDTETRPSHTGYILMMNSGLISWKSRQPFLSLSTSKAEFVAASQASQKVIYLRKTFRDFGYMQSTATDIFEDNLACIAINENLVRQFFCPHIDIRPYFVRELVKAKHVQRIPLRTQKMVADTLMKSLPLPAFIARHKVMLGQVSLSLKFLGA